MVAPDVKRAFSRAYDDIQVKFPSLEELIKKYYLHGKVDSCI